MIPPFAKTLLQVPPAPPAPPAPPIPPTPPLPPEPPATPEFITEVQGAGVNEIFVGGPPIHEVVLILGVIIVIGIVLYPLARALARRIEEGRRPSLSGEADARMERLEQAVDAMAVEIERISEGQRYATKLLTERLPGADKPGQEKLPR